MEADGDGESGDHRPSDRHHGTPPGKQPGVDHAAFSALLEDSAEDLYEHAPCGYLSTLLDGTIAKINRTLLDWLGYDHGDLVGRRSFSDLLTVGGWLYHETHFAPLLRMQGEVSGIALELKARDGTRLPVLVTSTVKTGGDGLPLLIRTTVFDARDRRAYETELLRARQEAEREREELKRLNVTLQQTLLPPTLVNVPGLDVAAHYHVASTDMVGGDFYDLFPLSAWHLGLFLGDVCGKGAAAAAVTSLARYTLRAAAVYDPDPAAVLGNLNTVLNHEYNGHDPRFCTVVFGLLTPRATAAASASPWPAAATPGPAAARRRRCRPRGDPRGPAHRRAARRPYRDRHRAPGGGRHPPAAHGRPHRGPPAPHRRPLRRRGPPRLRPRPGPHHRLGGRRRHP